MVRKQLVDPAGRMMVDPEQDIAEVLDGVDVMGVAGCDERVRKRSANRVVPRQWVAGYLSSRCGARLMTAERKTLAAIRC